MDREPLFGTAIGAITTPVRSDSLVGQGEIYQFKFCLSMNKKRRREEKETPHSESQKIVIEKWN